MTFEGKVVAVTGAGGGIGTPRRSEEENAFSGNG